MWSCFPIMLRAVSTTPSPCHTIANTGPDVIKSTNSPKKGFPYAQRSVVQQFLE